MTVFIPAPMTITSASVTNVACPQGNTGAINIAVTGAPGNDYSYSLNGGTPQSTGTFNNLTAGTYNVHVVDVAGLTCPVDTAFQVIELSSNFTVDAGQPVTIMSGEQIQLNGSAVNATSLLWTASPSDPSLTATTTATPSVSPMITTTYTLTATNSNGCVISDNVEITVIPRCINVRNAFSPNGDGINDKWKVYDNRDCLEKVTVTVFNRNGSKVFENQNYQNDWNGTFKNKVLPDATYYAVVEFFLTSGKRITAKSDVTILR
jgi:gliding motility-associated-like protein